MIRPDEALLIFKKWRDEEASLLCTSRLFSCWGFCLAGGVVKQAEDDGNIRIDSPDGKVVLSFSLPRAEAFEYVDLTHVPESARDLVPPEARERSFLAVATPLRVWRPFLKRDKLFFLELPRSSGEK